MHMLDKIPLYLQETPPRQKACEIHNIRWGAFALPYMRLRDYHKRKVEPHHLVKVMLKKVPLNTLKLIVFHYWVSYIITYKLNFSQKRPTGFYNLEHYRYWGELLMLFITFQRGKRQPKMNQQGGTGSQKKAKTENKDVPQWQAVFSHKKPIIHLKIISTFRNAVIYF